MASKAQVLARPSSSADRETIMALASQALDLASSCQQRAEGIRAAMTGEGVGIAGERKAPPGLNAVIGELRECLQILDKQLYEIADTLQ